MKINKKLFFIPIFGICYIFYIGIIYGFKTEISNTLKLWEAIIGNLMHSFFILLPFLMYVYL